MSHLDLRGFLWLMGFGFGVLGLVEYKLTAPVIVHEWGTFTSLQDENGQAIGGINVDDEPVPGFVWGWGGVKTTAGNAFPVGGFGLPPWYGGKGWMPGDQDVTMRLETPVLYFYPPKGQTPQSVPPLTVHVDFQAGFLEIGSAGSPNWIKVRIGRQEMEYGSGRLIDVREGPNVRLSFDGFKIKSVVDSWKIDLFAMRPDLDNPGFFDNAPNHTVGFWGIYAARPVTRTVSMDAYYLGLDRKRATFERGTARELRHTIGARIFGPAPTEKAGWDFDDEALWQFGTFGSADIKAWTVASDTGYNLPNMRLKPRFSVKADISSGDNPQTHSLGTFNPQFPMGNYFGVLATTGPGPLNFIDVHPRIQTQLPRSVTISTDWVFQWRENVLDGVYSVPGTLIRAAGNSRARYVGNRPGTEVRWQADRHLWFQADYGIFYPGEFLKQTKPSRDLNYWALWAGYKF